MNFEIKDYRQPVVTSLGIIIGFLAGMFGQWVTEDDFALRNMSDVISFWGIIIGLCLLFFALFQMLLPIRDQSKSLNIYKRVLIIYFIGLVVPLVSLILSAFI